MGPGNESESRASRVLQTGIALVHEGEVILPAAGSEAQAERIMADDRAVISYYFPVEIEVRVGNTTVDLDAIVSETLRRFAMHLENR